MQRADRSLVALAVTPLSVTLLALVVSVAVDVFPFRVARLGVVFDHSVLPAAEQFSTAVYAETAARISTVNGPLPPDAGLQSTTDASLVALTANLESLESLSVSMASASALLAPCGPPSCGFVAIQTLLSTLRNAADSANLASSFAALSTALSRTLYGAYLNTAASESSGQLVDQVGVSYAQLLAAAYLETSSLRAEFLYRNGGFGADTAQEALDDASIGAFVAARAQLKYLLAFSDIPFGLASTDGSYGNIIDIATSELAAAEAILALDSNLLLQAELLLTSAEVTGVQTAIADIAQLLSVAPTTPFSNTIAVRGLYVAVAALAVTAICLALSVYLSIRHLRASRSINRRLIEFSPPSEDIKVALKAYQNALLYLRTDQLPRRVELKNEVLALYDEAARVILEIRPFLPQTLHGNLVEEQQAVTAVNKNLAELPGSASATGKALLSSETPETSTVAVPFIAAVAAPLSGNQLTPWYAFEHAVRLDSAVTRTTCTFLTVVPLTDTLSLPRPRLSAATAESASGTLLGWYNTVLATVVALVNFTGGAVHSVECGGVIVCVWNLCSPCPTATSTALHVARALLHAFETIDMNIVTGPCMVANAKTGRRRNVVIVGSALEFSERVMLLNRLHSSSIVMDFDSYRDLSIEERLLCRPIALLHNGPSRVVLYSADWNAGARPSPQQRRDYLNAFALYQNGMFVDALNAFGKYLQAYPGDEPAAWVMSFLLSHKVYPVDAGVKDARPVLTDNDGAMVTLEDLAVWGGG